MAEKLAPDGAEAQIDVDVFSEAFARRMLGQPARRFAECDKHFPVILKDVRLHRGAHPEQSMDDAVDWALSSLFTTLDLMQARAFLARQRSRQSATQATCSRPRVSAAPLRRVRTRTRERRSSRSARRTSSPKAGDSGPSGSSSDGDGEVPPPPHPRRASQDRRAAS